MYKKNGLKVFMTNICSENLYILMNLIHLFRCLSSLNLSKYDEWRDTDLIYTNLVFRWSSIRVHSKSSKEYRGFENSVIEREKR